MGTSQGWTTSGDTFQRNRSEETKELTRQLRDKENSFQQLKRQNKEKDGLIHDLKELVWKAEQNAILKTRADEVNPLKAQLDWKQRELQIRDTKLTFKDQEIKVSKDASDSREASLRAEI